MTGLGHTTRTGVRRTSRRRPFTVALVGPDGAGKSTVSRLLETAQLPRPVKRIYMGLNLESTTVMLPTTRLLLAAHRSRADSQETARTRSTGAGRGWRGGIRDGLRMTAWMAEEWLRFAVANRYARRGYIVVFDRHFFLDYYHSDIAGTSRPDPRLFHRLHAWMLEHAHPRPELVVCLDVPGRVLFDRKGEASEEWLDRRRAEYRTLAEVVPAFVVVDADQPLDAVVSDVVEVIRRHWSDQWTDRAA
jgi:thymidylate kinase